MTGYSSQVPAIMRHYGFVAHPIVVQEFHPNKGWKRVSGKKRVSVSHARKLRDEGVTHICVSDGGPNVDFSIREILSRKAK